MTTVDQLRLRDRELAPVAEKVLAGERLDRDHGVLLANTDDLLGVGRLANIVRERQHGDRTYFNINRHLNPTNVCVASCSLCAFYVPWRDRERGWTYTVDEAVEIAARDVDESVTELHIVGGLHPDLPYDFYVEMMRRLKEALPDVLIQGFTAVEIEYFARLGEKSTLEVLTELRDAGLDSLPGGGAEIFSERLRSTAWEKKISGADWLRIHGEAHSIGMKTNCTMLYGHIETVEERVDHLVALRGQQDASGGFLAFIPLAFHPMNTELADLPGTTGFDDLKTLAISRLVLDNIPHIKAFWIMVGLKIAQIATAFGVDDIDGTVVEERITHAAGATTPEALSRADLVDMILETGHVPVERDTLYSVVREHAEAV
jgi:aminodeoxyfutalosine synthase